jgi:hypothetical protein
VHRGESPDTVSQHNDGIAIRVVVIGDVDATATQNLDYAELAATRTVRTHSVPDEAQTCAHHVLTTTTTTSTTAAGSWWNAHM